MNLDVPIDESYNFLYPYRDLLPKTFLLPKTKYIFYKLLSGCLMSVSLSGGY